MQISLVLTAAGNSTRMGNSLKKEFIFIEKDTSILSQSAFSFLDYFRKNTTHTLSQCIITLPQNLIYQGMDAFITQKTTNACIDLQLNPVFIEGGKTRQESVYKGLLKLENQIPQTDIVLIHDAARPFVDDNLIERLIHSTMTHGASVPIIPSVDSKKMLDPSATYIERHLERNRIVSVQTPQGFSYAEILHAHKAVSKNGKTYTDDSEIYAEYYKKPVFVIEGDIANKKITHQSDLPSH